MKNKKAPIIALVFILIISTLGIASAADAAQLSAGAAKPTATPGLGLWTPSPAPKPTATPGRGLWTPSPTPKPTATPEPVPSFEPGLREDHEGHDLRYDVLEALEYTHKIRIYCNDCKKKVRTYTEYHTLDESGHCTACTYQCKHQRTYVRTEQADGSKRSWDGEYITYPGTETTICYHCGKTLKYENKIIRKFHTMHLNTTEPEWIPNGTNGHYADVTCLDCDTAFRATHYHEYNREAPFTDDGDPETHTHMISCRDCGYSEERREPHAWVHESYKKDVSLGTDEGHIEVLKCSVCGAVKEVKQPHGERVHVAYRQEGDAKIHTEVLQCKLCGEQFELAQPHTLEHVSYKNDGDSEGHIDVCTCTVCGATVEKRTEHRPKLIKWESISDTQDRAVVRCNICGLTYTTATSAHLYTKGYQTNGYNDHTAFIVCTKCGVHQAGSERTELHSYDRANHEDGTKCKECNQYASHTHRLENRDSPHTWVPLDETMHVAKGKCCWEWCDEMIIDTRYVAEHTFDPLTLKCTGCGYLKEGCEHQYTYRPAKDGVTDEQHTFIGTCTGCGKEITVTEAHTFSPEVERFDDKTHLEKCEKCSYTRAVAHSFADAGSDDTHRCEKCGQETAHSYKAVNAKFISAQYHEALYECEVCHHRMQTEKEEHKEIEYYLQCDGEKHYLISECTVCGFRSYYIRQPHQFDEAGACEKCNYHKDEPVTGATLPEGLPEDIANVLETLSACGHLTADGKEIPFGCAFLPIEDGKTYNVVILPEDLPAGIASELRFTDAELETLRTLGVKSVYIRLNDTDVLLIADMEQISGEAAFTLTPASDGRYTVTADPA